MVVLRRAAAEQGFETSSIALNCLDFRVENRGVTCHNAVESAPPWCSTVIFRRFEKCLNLKDFYAVQNRWRRGRDSAPCYAPKSYLGMRIDAGKLIDPQTAEITWRHACMFDPYGAEPDLPEELQIVGREYYVRAGVGHRTSPTMPKVPSP
jgi:hypothetical protein